MGAKLSSGGPVGEDFRGQGAQNVKYMVFGGPEGKSNKNPMVLSGFRGFRGSQGGQANENMEVASTFFGTPPAEAGGASGGPGKQEANENMEVASTFFRPRGGTTRGGN